MLGQFRLGQVRNGQVIKQAYLIDSLIFQVFQARARTGAGPVQEKSAAATNTRCRAANPKPDETRKGTSMFDIRKTERQKDRKTETQKDRKTETQKDRKTERQKNRCRAVNPKPDETRKRTSMFDIRKTERQKNRKTESKQLHKNKHIKT